MFDRVGMHGTILESPYALERRSQVRVNAAGKFHQPALNGGGVGHFAPAIRAA